MRPHAISPAIKTLNRSRETAADRVRPEPPNSLLHGAVARPGGGTDLEPGGLGRSHVAGGHGSL
ncbi:MAG: hypothetical protein CME06_04045 [Gemmatimonadetes bacterium]|nr:hypothetical protein [Gemmatimonadota bacterium]